MSAHMKTLISKSNAGQWDIGTMIDWDQEIIVPEGLDLVDYIDSISQLYYAELFTIEACGKILGRLDNLEYKQLLGLQIADEARHASAYQRYLAKIGDLAPFNEKMRPLFNSILNWQGHPMATILAINFFLEGEAINQQNKRINTLPCPLFKQINQVVLKDESRHNAFGVIYMQENKNVVSQEEMQEILGWIRELWLFWKKNNDERYQHESAAILRNGRAELDGRWEINLKKLRGLNILPEEKVC